MTTITMFDDAISIVKKEFENVPDNGSMIEKVSEKLRQTYEKPPIQDFEMVVHKTFALEEVRTALFAPQEEQIPYYSTLLLAALESPTGHPLKKTGSLLLTLLYLIHRKNYTFLKEFVLADGILPITNYLRHDNLYERSQALEIFLSITDCDVYDWFQPPIGYSDKMLHHKLLDLSNHPHFLNNLLLNRTDSYPGGSFRALQLLAFWLSWVRALYTKDQTLQLSVKLTEELQLWSEQLPNEETGVMEEETQLAKTLFDDFCKDYKRESVSTASAAASISSYSISGIVAPKLPQLIPPEGTTLTTNVKEDSSNDARSDKKVMEEDSIDTAQRLKDEANSFYRTGNIDKARRSYEEALKMTISLRSNIQSTTDTASLDLLQMTLHTNLSNTLWKVYSQQETKSIRDGNSEAEFSDTIVNDNDIVLSQIISHCEAALSLQPTHAKACYRLVLTMIERKEHQLAYTRAEQFKQALLNLSTSSDNSSSSSSSSTIKSGFSHQVQDDIDRISRLQRRCTAVELLRCYDRDMVVADDNTDKSTALKSSSSLSSSSSSSFDCQRWGMDQKRLKLLSVILKRDHLSHIVPDCTLSSSSLSQQPEKANVAVSAASAAAKKAKEDIIKADPKVDKILNYLFEQRDETVDQGIASKVSKSGIKDSGKTVSGDKKKSSTEEKDKEKVKITSADRKAVQGIKRMAGSFSTLMLRAKSYSTEDATIVNEKETLMRDGWEQMEILLLQRKLSFSDLFLTLDDNDILFLVSLATFSLQTLQKQPLGFKIINGIVGADRIQSLLFLFRMEYPQVQAAAKATVQVVADTPDLKPSISKALAKYTVLLG